MVVVVTVCNICDLCCFCDIFFVNQAIGYSNQHYSVPVPSQGKLGRLWQERSFRIKMGCACVCCDSLIVTGDVLGYVKFFDQELKLLHWYFSIYPVSQKKRPPICFLITLSKTNRFLKIIFGVLNRQKIWHEHLIYLSASLVRCSHFT